MKIEDDISSPLSAQHLFQKKSDINTKMNFETVNVLSNHFPVSFQENVQFNEWHIRFLKKEDKEKFKQNPKEVEDPVPKDSRILIRQILRANRQTIQKNFGNHFDTGQTLYTFGKAQCLEKQYLLEDHDEYLVYLTVVNQNLQLKQLQLPENQKKQLLRFLNSKLKHILKSMHFYEFGRLKKYYNFDDKVDIPQHNVEIYKGFNTAFDIYEVGVRLLIDNSCRILRTKNLWQEFLETNIRIEDFEAIRKHFIGINCVASYGNNRRYKIDDVKFDLKVSDPFPDPTFSSFADYFKQKYKKSIHYHNQFMLVSKTTFFKRVGDHEMEKVENLVDLVPELLQGTGLTDQQKSNFHVMKDIGQTTIQSPQRRFNQINQLAQDINNCAVDSFRFKIDFKNNVLKAYKLPKPKLLADQKFQPQRDRIQLQQIYRNEKIKDWVLLYDFKFSRDVDRIINQLIKSTGRYGLKISEPLVVKEIPKRCRVQDLPDLYEHKIQKPKIIFFICSQYSANQYYAGAKSLFQKIGIPTQFYTSFNFRKDQLSKYGNMTLQMVNKIGGALWVYQNAPPDTIVIGIDKLKLKNGTVVASAVAQMGKYFRKPLAVLEQVNSSEDSLHQAISRIIMDIIKYYVSRYDKTPKDVLVYRQCQGAREIQNMIEQEILLTKQKIQQKYHDSKNIPRLNVILVTKKINDRFVQFNQNGLENPEGVAVVDDVVMPDRINFFLVAQKVNQGTATPTHYQVVYNQSEFSLQQMVSLTYDLTYLYLNWLGPVRIPSALQYVEKLCSLIQISQQPTISKNIRSLLYFL